LFWGEDHNNVVINDRPYLCSLYGGAYASAATQPYGYFLLLENYLSCNWSQVASASYYAGGTIPYTKWKNFQQTGTRILFCPSFVSSRTLHPLNSDGQGFNCTDDTTYQYGMNGYFSNGGNGACLPSPYDWYRPPINLAKFQKPGSTLWFADQKGWLDVLWDDVDFRHSDAANLCFVDGHVEHVRRTQLPPLNGSTGAYTDYPWYYATTAY
jgi:prepilin-type processing-associated H-X9-DG protein